MSSARHPTSEPDRTSESPDTVRLPYAPPRLERLGTLRELTLGQGGSNMDQGHLTPTKRGMG